MTKHCAARDPGRRGFVLVAAIVALVLIALLITGAFFASGQDLTISRAELRDEQAFGYAELAVSQALESWDATARETMSVGETVTLETASDPPLESSVFITRLDSALYIVAGEGRLSTADGYGLRRRVGITVQTIVGGGRVSRPERVPGQGWSELY